jgi:hypothetical protein
MNFSLGKVTVANAGVPVRLTNNQADPAVLYRAHSYLVEVLSSNTGKVYIGAANLDKSTLVGVYAILAPPTTNIYPTFSSTISNLPNPFNIAAVWIDVDVNGEGALVSVIQA